MAHAARQLASGSLALKVCVAGLPLPDFKRDSMAALADDSSSLSWTEQHGSAFRKHFDNADRQHVMQAYALSCGFLVSHVIGLCGLLSKRVHCGQSTSLRVPSKEQPSSSRDAPPTLDVQDGHRLRPRLREEGQLVAPKAEDAIEDAKASTRSRSGR